MALTDYVSVNIVQSSAGLQQAGFGIPLILSATATWTERTRTYNNLPQVVADFPTTSGPEYLAAQALFAQSPAPSVIMIGRLANKPTQITTIAVSTLHNLFQYKLNVQGAGVTTTAVAAVATGSSAANDAAVALIVTALNLVTGKNYTATATGTTGSQIVTVTGTTAGAWFSIEAVTPTDLAIDQTATDAGIVADMNAISLESSLWYAVINTCNSTAIALLLSGWCEANKKLYVFDTNATAIVTGAKGDGDLADTLMGLGGAYTSVWYHPSPANMLASCLLGLSLPQTPGSDKWAIQILNQVLPVNLTPTQRANLVAKNANSYEQISNGSSSTKVTFNGTVASGGYIDSTRNLDFLKSDIVVSIFSVLAAAKKVPFSDPGAQLIVSQLRAALQRAVNSGILLPGFTVTCPPVSTIPLQNRQNRIIPNITFLGQLSQAVQGVTPINGVVTL